MKTIEEMAREYTAKDRAAEIENSNGCYNDQQTYYAFIAGANHVLDKASVGFEEWFSFKATSFQKSHCDYFLNNEGFVAAKLSSQKEIDELKNELKELKRDLEWTLKFINPLITHSGSEYGKKEAIHTKHFGNEKEGV